MAKEDLNNEERTQIGDVRPRILEEEMKTSYLDYAMSVIVARALPDVRDGLKPVHRRVLYAMWVTGLRPNARFRKSAAVVGEVLKSFHPHGDTAVYDSLVRLAQPFNMRYPLVEGQGNFGSMDGDSAAAMRYTEAKMAAISSEMLSDIEKDTVDFMPNYDGTQTEPVVLPSRVPNLLINGTLGIAVGMATNIPPHNLGEVIDGTVHLIDNPEATIEDLMKFIQGPDFPTGGTIFGIEGIRNIYSPQGKGSVAVRAVAEVVEGKKNDFQIIVSEIPYAVNKSTLITRMAELVKEKKIVGISDIRDESDKDGVRIVVDLKKDAYAKKILNQLYKMTAMQTVFHANMVALVDGIQPRTLSLKNILEEFIEHRRRVVVRRAEFELKKAREREHILEGLKIALDQIDKVIATIKKSKDKEAAKAALVKEFKLSELQAIAILDMRLSTLAALERQKVDDELKVVRGTIAGLEDLLKSPTKRDTLIKTELTEIKTKYDNPRRTKIIKHEIGKFSDEDLIPNEDVIVTLTRGGYIKRTPVNIYRAQGRGGKGVVGMGTKEEDVVEILTFAKNHDFVLFFTNEGRVFQSKVYEIPVASRTAKGQALQNLVQAAPDEKVTSIIVLTDFNDSKYLLMATKHGTVKKTLIKQFENVRKVGIRAIGIDKGDQLKWVRETSGENDIIMATKMGQALRTHESEIRAMGRSAYGVRGIRLRSGDELVGADVVEPKSELLVITQNGFGKRTELDQFDVHHRGGVGIRAGKVTDKTGPVVDVRVISSDIKGDLIIISKQGQIIRLPIATISKIGRDTQGVRVMRLDTGDKVASVASVEKEEEDNLDETAPVPETESVDVKDEQKEKITEEVKSPKVTNKVKKSPKPVKAKKKNKK